VVCAALLPHVVEANLRALRERTPDAAVLHRFDEAAILLSANASAVAEDLLRWLRALHASLGLPGLGSYGLREEHLPELAAKAARANSMKANPIALDERELMETVRAAL
jgi:alcohol dehydrogenase class IV